MKKGMFKIKNSSGITLLVLVITIIILLILAGVVIAQLTNGGLLKNSKKATNEYNKQIASEKINLKILDLQMTSLLKIRRCLHYKDWQMAFVKIMK